MTDTYVDFEVDIVESDDDPKDNTSSANVDGYTNVRYLNLSDNAIMQLEKSFGTPFQIYDERMIIDNANKFLTTFKNLFPQFRQYFAVKALPNPHILQILRCTGMGLDCSSRAELHVANKLGTDIMFSSNYTSSDDFKYAMTLSNLIINFDDIDGVQNLLDSCTVFPKLVCFRLNPKIGTTDSETSSNVLGGEHSKFGIPSHMILEAYAKAIKHGATEFGIHTMTGSCVMDTNYWNLLIDTLFVTVNELKTKLDIDLKFINIGGGIGIPYKPDVPNIDIEQLAKTIRAAFDRNLKLYNMTHEPALYMENGRYITGPYGWLVAKCHSIKKGYNDTIYYGLDASMSNLMRPGMYGSYHHVTVVGKDNETDLQIANVVGTLCENNDWFAKDRLLPKNINKGDLFVIHDTGAHGHSMGFQYNGKLRAPELSIDKNGIIKMIRHRETIDSLYSNCPFYNLINNDYAKMYM